MKQILIADDSIVTQLTLSHILEEEGCQVYTVTNGREAFNRLQQQSFDILISDINMPEWDGLTLLEIIRSDEILKDLPVILITGTEEQLTQARASSANGVLIKPVSSWQVVDSVARTMGANR